MRYLLLEVRIGYVLHYETIKHNKMTGKGSHKIHGRRTLRVLGFLLQKNLKKTGHFITWYKFITV